jgi:hypothetical protein
MIDRAETAPDSTFGGYLAKHERPPAFEGTDGAAYSASVYVADFPDAHGRFGAAVLFVRWSPAGDRPTGHVETPVIARGATREQAIEAVEALSLLELRALLDEAIRADAERPDW